MSYLQKQRQRYADAMSSRAQPAQWADAVWRAASHENLLRRDETDYGKLSAQRIAELVQQLGWD